MHPDPGAMLRSHRGCVVVAFALVACGGRTEQSGRTDAAIARDSNPPGITMTACGRVVSYVAGDVARGGRLELDHGRWDLVPGAPVAFEVLLVPGDRVCVYAEIEPDRRIAGAYVFRPGEDDQAADAPTPLAAEEQVPTPAAAWMD